MDRSADPDTTDGRPYVLFDARVGSPGRLTHAADVSSRRPDAHVKKVDRHQSKVRFSDWGDRWLESLERKPSTVGSYRSTIAHAKKTFGAKYGRTRPRRRRTFQQNLGERGCSPSTRAKHLRVLGACLQAAVFYRLRESNPVRELPPAHRPRPERKEAAYSRTRNFPVSSHNSTTRLPRRCVWLRSRQGCGKENCLLFAGMTSTLEQAVVRVRRRYTGGDSKHTEEP